MANDDDDTVSDDDDDLDEDAPKKKSGGANGVAGGPRAPSSHKDNERKKRELITMGKAKGFLTYDEVNEHMPENILSSEQVDDWLSAFSGEGIELDPACLRCSPARVECARRCRHTRFSS